MLILIPNILVMIGDVEIPTINLSMASTEEFGKLFHGSYKSQYGFQLSKHSWPNFRGFEIVWENL